MSCYERNQFIWFLWVPLTGIHIVMMFLEVLHGLSSKLQLDKESVLIVVYTNCLRLCVLLYMYKHL